MKSFKFFKPAPATTLAIGSWRLILLLATAVSLIGYPNPGSAATFNVWVGVSHSPSSVIFLAFVGNDPPWRSGDVDLGLRAGTAQRQAGRACPPTYGILEFVARERLSLTHSTA